MVLAPVCLTHTHTLPIGFVTRWLLVVCVQDRVRLGTVWIIMMSPLWPDFETQSVRPFFVSLRVDSFALDLALACGVCMVKCSSRDNVLGFPRV